MLYNYNPQKEHYALPTPTNEYRLEDYRTGEEDTLGSAGTFFYRPHHNIQYTEFVVQNGKF